MAYLLDTNVFIEAKNLYYGFDFCPAFWEWVLASHAAKKVYGSVRLGKTARLELLPQALRC